MHERFATYLEYKRLSVRKVSELSCVSASTISRFCAGKEIGSDKLLKILQVCDDLSLEWFFYGTGEMIRSCGEGVTVNMGTFAGADVNNSDGVLVNGSRQVSVKPEGVRYYQKMLEEKDRVIASKDRVISERDSMIRDLLDKISGR